MRLAACGFLHKSAGSSATALYHVLREILNRGHAVDLYHLPGMWEHAWLAGQASLRAIEVRDPTCMAIWRGIDRVHPHIPPRFRQLLMAGFGLIANTVTFAEMGRRIRAAHTQHPYDALMVLNTLSPWRILGLRIVSWPQGPPCGESDFLIANARTLSSQLGLGYFTALMAGYRLKHAQHRANARKSDLIIGGSQWSVSGWRRFGVPAAKLATLPFPLGPEAMQPPAIADTGSDSLLFLHIGRIVPRKRLDLVVRGFAEFRRSFPDARLLVIGQQDYGRDLEILRTDATMSAGVEYRGAVPREEVAGLVARADCVVQTSENENFGAAVAEALAAGRPVLVGPTNGTKDYVPASSVVFAEYTPAAVAAGMAEVARRIEADRFGLCSDARAAAERHFDLARVTDRFLDLIQHDAVRHAS
jgi:glycosyltransferase involved in cell wall biosynthesis